MEGDEMGVKLDEDG